MKKIMIHLERCYGCKRCEIECVSEHLEIKKYIKASISNLSSNTRIFVESILDRPFVVVCKHCKEPLCVSACMSGCMQKDPSTGIVSNTGHEQVCVGCWMCIMACPFGVINASFDIKEEENKSLPQAIKCDFCPRREIPACVEACPNKALEIVEMKEDF